MDDILLDRRSLVAGGAIAGTVPLLASGLAMAQSNSSKLLAFVTGTNDYRNLTPLTASAEDAVAVSKKLSSVGYRCQLATDRNEAQLRAELDAFVQGIEPGSTAVLYLSGHGIQISGNNFLLASDFEVDDQTGEMSGALSLGEILATVAEAGPDNCLCIIDACRDNPVPTFDFECSAGLASVLAPGGFYLAYAAGSGQTAMDRISEGDPSPNGLFVRYLLPHIQPTVPVDEMIKRTRVEVTRAATVVGHSQNPAIYDQSTPFNLAGQSVDGQASAIVRDINALIEDCIGLVVGVGSYRTPTEFIDFPGTISDANKFSLSLEEHGVELYGNDPLIDPTESEMLDACLEIAQIDKRMIFYFAGAGFLHRGDGYLVTESDEADLSTAISVMRVAEILALSKKPALMAIDCGLPEIGARANRDIGLTYAQGPTLSEFYGSGRWPNANCGNNLAMIYSSNFFQAALDLAENSLNSPFEAALANAISRPGLSTERLATMVRSEVVDMTKRFQTPIFAGSQAIMEHVWVTETPQWNTDCSSLEFFPAITPDPVQAGDIR